MMFAVSLNTATSTVQDPTAVCTLTDSKLLEAQEIFLLAEL